MEPDEVWKAPGPFSLSGLAIRASNPISLQSGEPRTLKHCKNTYKSERTKSSGDRARLYRPLIHRQDPYKINLFGEYTEKDKLLISTDASERERERE
jgi:hypothetical protein